MKHLTLRLIYIFALLTGCLTFISPAQALTPTLAADDSAIERQNFTLPLDTSISTKAELDLPRVGSGPFPAVLFLGGSGATDLDGATPAFPNLKPYREMADNLTRRGFVVLRYNKRGLDTGGRIANQRVSDGRTRASLVADGLVALRQLQASPQVDPNRLYIVAHSQGTTIAAQLALTAPGRVKGLVLIGAITDWSAAFDYQLVDFYLAQANAIDADHDGLLTPAELTASLNSNPDSFANYRHNLLFGLNYFQATNRVGQPPTVNCESPLDTNHDCRFSISDELKPTLDKTRHNLLTSPTLLKAAGESATALQSMLAAPRLEGELVKSGLPVLFQHGANDERAPLDPVRETVAHLGPTASLKIYPALTHPLVPDDIILALSLKKPVPAQVLPQTVLDDQTDWLSKLASAAAPLPATLPAIVPSSAVVSPGPALPAAGGGWLASTSADLSSWLILFAGLSISAAGLWWLKHRRKIVKKPEAS